MRFDTLALWFGPLAVLLAGGLGAFIYVRSRARSRAEPLSADEEAEVEILLKTDKAG
jgi:cytochrome c-type biogenesis protein CcmH/NrfF